jgi:hypothetical protein
MYDCKKWKDLIAGGVFFKDSLVVQQVAFISQEANLTLLFLV